MTSPFRQQHIRSGLTDTGVQQAHNSPSRETELEILQPLIFTDDQQQLRISTTITQQCLKSDLSVKRLDQIHRHLWWAGRPHAARPLHKQLLLGRQITITEQADLHLLWFEDHIFIKPLPVYILNPSIWDEYICNNTELYEAARGILLSYLWLIRHKSDFDIAKNHSLLPDNITWRSWFKIVDDVRDSFDLMNPKAISKRYDFGELRIRRLNQIARLRALRSLNIYGVIKGYRKTYTNYKSFFDSNFRWIIIAFAFGSVLLSAFQVGLTTDELNATVRFQDMSVGLALFFVAAPLFLVAFPFVLFISLFLYFLGHTLRFNKKRFAKDSISKGDARVPV
jgi:hypothetical protein